MEMDKSRDYMVYRDAETDRVSVLVRRRDGHFDLVES
jgi:putative sigma-54 modulation protein